MRFGISLYFTYKECIAIGELFFYVEKFFRSLDYKMRIKMGERSLLCIISKIMDVTSLIYTLIVIV